MSPMNPISILIKETFRAASPLPGVGHSKKLAVHERRRRRSLATDSAGTDFPASRIVGNQCLLCEALNVWWFLRAA